MFADPTVVKFNGADKNHVRIRIADGVGEFRWKDTASADNQNVKITQSRSKGRARSEFRLTRSKDWENPLTNLTTPNGISVYLVVDRPANESFNDDDCADMISNVATFLTASSNAKAYMLVRGES